MTRVTSHDKLSDRAYRTERTETNSPHPKVKKIIKSNKTFKQKYILYRSITSILLTRECTASLKSKASHRWELNSMCREQHTLTLEQGKGEMNKERTEEFPEYRRCASFYSKITTLERINKQNKTHFSRITLNWQIILFKTSEAEANYLYRNNNKNTTLKISQQHQQESEVLNVLRENSHQFRTLQLASQSKVGRVSG